MAGLIRSSGHGSLMTHLLVRSLILKRTLLTPMIMELTPISMTTATRSFG